ncbi:MAG: sulfotransferase domain-containing protein [Actinobacteria bacterium]|nr:sulfotransferase domain-containing protein [Actinomycetota bacterium]
MAADSARWDGFTFRHGDIVVSTPPKCGTTWTQTICCLLVSGGTELDRPLAEVSPWLDMQTNVLADIYALFAAQTHRRVIKTHTPLDGLPVDERATYVCVGRDPRDVALSWEHHMANMNLENFLNARMTNVGLDDLADMPVPVPPPEDPIERFWAWVDGEPDVSNIMTLGSIFHHYETFWDVRDQPGFGLFHYADLLADLPGEITRLAGVVGIDITERRAEQLAQATSFDRMKAQADRLIPDNGNAIFLDNAAFFHNGGGGQWRDLLDDAGLERYQRRVAELAPPDIVEWAHTGSLGVSPSAR